MRTGPRAGPGFLASVRRGSRLPSLPEALRLAVVVMNPEDVEQPERVCLPKIFSARKGPNVAKRSRQFDHVGICETAKFCT